MDKSKLEKDLCDPVEIMKQVLETRDKIVQLEEMSEILIVILIIIFF